MICLAFYPKELKNGEKGKIVVRPLGREPKV